MTDIVKQELIAKKIILIRGLNVMLDRDLAELYGVKTKSLNLAVKRNMRRFPSDFMFQLSKDEFANLRFQIETSSWGGVRYQPYVFTEQGVAMLSSVLSSMRAVRINIGIMRVFVNVRRIVAANKVILEKLNQLENKFQFHDKKLNADIHDRWIVSKNLCYNMPSTDTVARGQYSEVIETGNYPPFDKWWRKSRDI